VLWLLSGVDDLDVAQKRRGRRERETWSIAKTNGHTARVDPECKWGAEQVVFSEGDVRLAVIETSLKNVAVEAFSTAMSMPQEHSQSRGSSGVIGEPEMCKAGFESIVDLLLKSRCFNGRMKECEKIVDGRADLLEHGKEVVKVVVVTSVGTEMERKDVRRGRRGMKGWR
jgi:hypothetical protein